MKIIKHCFPVLLICVIAFACKPKPSTPSIVGTWTLTIPDSIKAKDPMQMQITFNSDSTALTEVVQAGAVTDKDTMSYHIIDNGAYLVTKEKSGREDKLKILELTDKTLRLTNEAETPATVIVLTKK